LIICFFTTSFPTFPILLMVHWTKHTTGKNLI
jgi:hypothetical protein